MEATTRSGTAAVAGSSQDAPDTSGDLGAQGPPTPTSTPPAHAPLARAHGAPDVGIPLLPEPSSGGVGLVQVDPVTRCILSADARFCRLCGYAEDELIGRDVDHLNPPQDRFDPVRFNAILRGDSDGLRERPLRRKDGRIAWVELSSHVVRDAQGRPLYVLAIVTDLGAQRRQWQRLHAREARMAFLVRLSDALRRLDDPQAITFEASRLLGEFVGAERVGYAKDGGDGETVSVARNYTAGVPGIEGRYRYADYGADLVQALRAGHTVVRPDIAGDPTLDAHEKAAHAVLQLGATVNVPVLKGGRLEAIFFVHSTKPRDWTPDEVGLFEDVAERLRADLERARAETAQRAASTQLEAALASMSDAVVITDVTGRYVRINEAFVTFHRRHSQADCPTTTEQVAQSVEVSLPDGTPVEVSQWTVPRALRGESGHHQNFRLRRRDTGETWIGSYSFAPIRDGAGAVTGAVVTARDITQLARLQAELAATHDELQRLVAAQDRALEEERLRIARELHDDMQQSLVAMLMEVGAARAALAASGAAVPGADEALGRIGALSRQAIAATRRIICDLRPQALEELGLEASLNALAEQFAVHSGIACRVDTRGLERADPRHLADIGTCLYRVTQEALNNIAKHARARGVRIRLHRLRNGRVRLSVTDDGAGLAAGARDRRDAFGLLGMRERLRALGGTLDVRSRPGRGTTVEATLPAPARTSAQARRARSNASRSATPARPQASTPTAKPAIPA